MRFYDRNNSKKGRGYHLGARRAYAEERTDIKNPTKMIAAKWMGKEAFVACDKARVLK